MASLGIDRARRREIEARYREGHREVLRARAHERGPDDRERHRERIRVTQATWYERHGRASELRINYGMTITDYDAMLARQGGGCAICGSTTSGGRGRHFHVDHDHVSGKVRGLLCHRCNVGLAPLETLGWIDRALAYLTRTD